MPTQRRPTAALFYSPPSQSGLPPPPPPSAFRTDKRSAAKQASDTLTRLTDRQRETGAGPIAHFVIVGPFAGFAGV